MEQNKTNEVWQVKSGECLAHFEHESAPRGMNVREIKAGQYKVLMPAYLDLVDRKVNANFMFAEAAWIVSGHNQLWELTDTMKAYANFSDDGVFLRGAYGPKVVDQLGYIVDSIESDLDTRQAVINIWRERPSKSKDIPCTLSMQFLVREGYLHMLTTMRSHDIVLGFTYDVFTFSMVAKAVQLLLKDRGIDVMLGDLVVTAGSLHLYENYYEKVEAWLDSEERDRKIGAAVAKVCTAQTYRELIENLKQGAQEYGEAI